MTAGSCGIFLAHSFGSRFVDDGKRIAPQAIRDGITVAISADGSFQDKFGTASWVLLQGEEEDEDDKDEMKARRCTVCQQVVQ